MKSFFVKCLMLCAALTLSVQANAQVSLGNILKNVVSGEKGKTETDATDGSKSNGLLSALTNVFSSSKVATKDKIVGTWVYEEPAVLLSSDNTLKNIGGKLASSTIEKKLKDKLEGYGFNASSA